MTSKKPIPRNTFYSIEGQSLEPGEWVPVDQSRIDLFADATDDHQFIHIDPVRAGQTDFGGTIAHGFLSLSLLPRLVKEVMLVPEGMLMGINYGFNHVRFLSPVKSGDQIRVQGSVKSVVEKDPGRFLVTLTIQLEIKGSESLALVCEWLNYYVCE